MEGNQIVNNTIMLKDFNSELSKIQEKLVLKNFMKLNNFTSFDTMKIFFSYLSNQTSNTEFQEFINEINKTLNLFESLRYSSVATELTTPRFVTLILILGTTTMNMIFNSDLSLLFETLNNSWTKPTQFHMDLPLLKELFEAKNIIESIQILQTKIEKIKDVETQKNLKGFLSELMNRYFLFLGCNNNITLGRDYLNAKNQSEQQAIIQNFIKLANKTKEQKISNSYQLPCGLNSSARQLFMEEVSKLNDKQKLTLSQFKFEKVLNSILNVTTQLLNNNSSSLAIPSFDIETTKLTQEIENIKTSIQTKNILTDEVSELVNKLKQNHLFLDSMTFVFPDQNSYEHMNKALENVFKSLNKKDILLMFNYSGVSCRNKILNKFQDVEKFEVESFLTNTIQSNGKGKNAKTLISKIFINFIKNYNYISQYATLLNINETEDKNNKMEQFSIALQNTKEDFQQIKEISKELNKSEKIEKVDNLIQNKKQE